MVRATLNTDVTRPFFFQRLLFSGDYFDQFHHPHVFMVERATVPDERVHGIGQVHVWAALADDGLCDRCRSGETRDTE